MVSHAPHPRNSHTDDRFGWIGASVEKCRCDLLQLTNSFAEANLITVPRRSEGTNVAITIPLTICTTGHPN